MMFFRWILSKMLDLLFGEPDELDYNPEFLRPNPLPV